MGFCALALLTQSGCFAQAVFAPSINVKDFGAVGDGVHDDTAAIQAAVNAACAGRQEYWNDMCGAAHPEMVFPSGTYLISKPIIFANEAMSPVYALVRGIGKVTIRQADPTADAFYFHFAYRVHVRNLNFESGKRCIKLWTNNMDVSVLSIEDCSFADSTGYAIECVSRRTVDEKQVDHYEVSKDGVSYIEGGDAPYYYNSTALYINRCSFRKCMRFLHTNTDGCFVENCEMETNPDMTGAAIRNGGHVPIIFGGSGVMKLENVSVVFHMRDGKDQRWIENHGFGLTLHNVRITTDGRGVCPIYSYAQFHTGMWTQAYIIIEDSRFAAAGSPENAIVYCREVPNLISIRNCKSTNGPVPALGFAETPEADYFKMYSHCREPMPPEGLGYTIHGNSSITTNLPPSMRQFERKPLPPYVDELVRKWSTDKDAFLSERSFKAPTKIVSAGDFGAKGDRTTDDTEAIRKAAKACPPGGELQLAGGIYKVSGVIDLPPSIIIRGLGRAVFFAAKPGQGGFRVKAARMVAFQNCAFESLQNAANITVARSTYASGRKDRPEAYVNILFKNCVFSHTRGTAVQCVAGNLKTDGSAFARLRITDSVFQSCRKNLVSNISAVVDNTWISTLYVKKNEWHKDFASFENYGFLRCENSVGVPLVEARGRNMRWIDNYGRLIATSIRFGGEYGGDTAVNIRRTPGVRKNITIIQNGWLYSQNPDGRQALVYCEDAPDLLALRTNVGAEDIGWIVGSQLATVRLAAAAKVPKRLLFSGNTIPEDVVSGMPKSLKIPATQFPKTNPKDTGEMIFVPAGEFLMGSVTGYQDERPRHPVYLDAYRIGKYEVTVGQYRGFCDRTGRAMPDAPKTWNVNPQAAVINVSWDDASAYAEWVGGRLPTEAEWEKAARGDDGRLYPWGDNWNANICRQYDTGIQGVAPVGSYPSDISSYGCYDMGGNVCEWALDWYSEDYYKASPKQNPTGPPTGKYRVIRGGSWNSIGASGIRSSLRKLAEPDWKWLDIGFRVVWPGE